MPLDPLAVIIFGASGDLASRKLLPALYSLFLAGALPERSFILGVSRTALDDDAFRERALAGIAGAGLDPGRWRDFAPRLAYQPLGYDDPAGYAALGERLAALEGEHGTGARRIYYLALPPDLHGSVAAGLGRAGLAHEEGVCGWRRLVVEKPFGRDLASARTLGAALLAWFPERRIFRIDHYMTKETVQNILVLRFANAIFEPLWNRMYIDHVRINASESLGVGRRAGYFEGTGVLRDMFQNHLMQLLSLVAMEPPSRFDAERVRSAQSEIFRALKPLEPERIDRDLVLGQYGPGTAEGAPAPGYLEEPGIDPESTTPTYGLLRVFIDNWRWQGVPFYLSSGKRLRRKHTRIDIQFKPVPHRMFPADVREDLRPNRLVIGIQPEDDIFLMFQAKQPGPRLDLRTVGLSFDYRTPTDAPEPDAYAKALLDVMAGEQMLFWRQDGLEACWAFYEPLLEALDGCRHGLCDLHPYPAGSWGPPAAIDLLPDGSWPEKP
ncbi:MAG: glucose-6-phosphate dehydrogenase [Candidatus Methylomirabilia bacterium]